MGIIDHLWDETLAGPRPDSFPSSAVAGATAVPKPLPVTRSITIVRSGHRFHSPDSAPSSPVSAPESPLTPGTPRSDWRRSLRKPPATSAAAAAAAEPRTPTVYDWFVCFCPLFLANNSIEMLMLVASDLKSLNKCKL